MQHAVNCPGWPGPLCPCSSAFLLWVVKAEGAEHGNKVWGSCNVGIGDADADENTKANLKGPSFVTPVNSPRTSKAVSLEMHYPREEGLLSGSMLLCS